MRKVSETRFDVAPDPETTIYGAIEALASAVMGFDETIAGDGIKIIAIRDWVMAETTYTPGASHGGTTAVDTFQGRQGVCRDYAHLVCALSRAAGIPARYTSVYGPDVDPPDFHAVAEVWLGDAWHLVDATGMGTPDRLIIIASGRDAGDVAFMETEHWADPLHHHVSVRRLSDSR